MKKYTVKDFNVVVVSREEVSEFIEKNHYSHNINGVHSEICFALKNAGELIGAAIFGKMAMRNAYKKYHPIEKEIIELRRLVCIDDTPKNTESYFIGHMLRYLRKFSQYKVVISYADSTYGHRGTIYKASNFELIGVTKAARIIKRLCDGKLYHDKTIRTKYRGRLKPFAKRLKNQLTSGEAVYIPTKQKFVYRYYL